MTFKVGTIINDKGFEKAMKSIGFLRSMDVRVGYIKDSTDRKETGDTNAGLAYFHNFGAPKRNIPPRPYLEPALNKTREQCLNIMRAGMREALAGSADAERKTLVRCGTIIRDAAKEIIRNQEGFAPLSERTLIQRQQKKFKGTKALIHTGQLLNAITFEVKDA